jgi:hypothetical protein
MRSLREWEAGLGQITVLRHAEDLLILIDNPQYY